MNRSCWYDTCFVVVKNNPSCKNQCVQTCRQHVDSQHLSKLQSILDVHCIHPSMSDTLICDSAASSMPCYHEAYELHCIRCKVFVEQSSTDYRATVVISVATENMWISRHHGRYPAFPDRLTGVTSAEGNLREVVSFRIMWSFRWNRRDGSYNPTTKTFLTRHYCFCMEDEHTGWFMGDDVDMNDTLQQERNQMFFCLLSAIVEVLIVVSMTVVSSCSLIRCRSSWAGGIHHHLLRSVLLSSPPSPPSPLIPSLRHSPSSLRSFLLPPSLLASLCPSLSLLRVSLYLCVSPCVSPCVSLSVSIRISRCVSLCASLSVSVSLRLCVSVSLSLSLSYVFVSLSTCLHVAQEVGSYVSVCRRPCLEHQSIGQALRPLTHRTTLRA